MRQGHIVQSDQGNFDIPFGHDHHAVASEDGPATFVAMFDNHGFIAILFREEDHRRVTVACHGGDQRIVRLEDGRSFRRKYVNNRPLDQGQLLGRFDIGNAEVVPFANVRNNSHVAAVKAETGPQNSAACGFENRDFDRTGSSARPKRWQGRCNRRYRCVVDRQKYHRCRSCPLCVPRIA